MKATIALIVAGLLALSGCSGGTGSPVGPTVEPPTVADALAFRYATTPGLPSPGAAYDLPEVSVYGDGRLVRWSPDPAAPAVSLPAPELRRLTPAGIRRLLDAARDAGLTGPTDYGTPMVQDAPVTTFTVPGRVTKVTVLQSDSGELSRDQREARERLRMFVGLFADLDAFLGADISGGEPYAYSRLLVFAWPQDPTPGAPQRPWPFGEFAPVSGQVGQCVVFTGNESMQVRAAAEATTPNTDWNSGDQVYRLTFRPLLPDEPDCDSLPR